MYETEWAPQNSRNCGLYKFLEAVDSTTFWRLRNLQNSGGCRLHNTLETVEPTKFWRL